MAEAETWTPMVVVLPDRIVEALKRETLSAFRSADDDERLTIENFCAEVGWPSDALAIGGWLTLVIDKHLGISHA